MVQYDTSETAYLNLLYSYNQLMDGGNTNTLLSQIEQSWSQDAWNLRSSLIDKSPYLSEDVLRETALQNVLPQAMLLEVCLANPDATRSDKFLDFLRDDISNPLPEYMIEMIIASWNQETERTMLEGSLAHFSHEMAFVSDLLLTDLYLDTIGIVHYSDIRYWLNRTQTIPAKYRLAENYFQEHQYDSASSILASIPDNFDMSLDDVKEYNRYCYYVNFRHSILAGERNLMQLNGEEVDTLSDFAENGNDLGGMLAQNLLCFGYNICYEYNPNLPEGNYMRMGNSNSYKQALREINKVEVLPNPASTFATFSYKFPLLKSKAAVSISDVTGKIIEQFLIVNRQGQIIWDTRKIANGIYLYQIKDENSVLANGKVVVEK